MAFHTKEMKSLKHSRGMPINTLSSNRNNNNSSSSSSTFSKGRPFSIAPSFQTNKFDFDTSNNSNNNTNSSDIENNTDDIFRERNKRRTLYATNSYTIKPPSQLINNPLINEKFKLFKYTVSSKIENISTEKEDLTLILRHDKLEISSESLEFRVKIPYHNIQTLKAPNLNNKNSTYLFGLKKSMSQTLDDKEHRIVEFVIYLNEKWSIKQTKQLEDLINLSLDDHFVTVKSFDTKDTTTYFDPRSFAASEPNSFYGLKNKSRNKKVLRDILTPTSSSIDLDNPNRRERTQRVKSTIHYMNEDEDEEKASEQMVVENGISTISDYVPDDQQIYFDPNLKYKFDNKKTFTITNNDFNCLYNGNWINDTLVDFFIMYQLKISKDKKIPKVNNIEIMNSFFFTSLSRPIENDNYYQNVKSWFKSNNNLFDKDFIIIPVMQDLHWYLVIITDLKYLKRKHSKITSNDKNSNDDSNKEDNEDNENNDSNDNNKDINSGINVQNKDNNGDNDTPIIDRLPIDDDLNDNEDTIDNTNDDNNTSNNNESSNTDKSSKKEKVNGIVQICILDSLRRNHEKDAEYLKSFLISYAAEKYKFKINRQEINKHVCIVPQQKNFNDCGIHVLFNVQTFLEDPIKFKKTILKRPYTRKISIKTRKENLDIFNADKRLNLREDTRNLLVNLLKEQEIKIRGDASHVCTKTIKEQRILDLKSRKIVSNDLEDTTENDGKSDNIENKSKSIESEIYPNNKENLENINSSSEKQNRVIKDDINKSITDSEGDSKDSTDIINNRNEDKNKDSKESHTDDEEDDDLMITHVSTKEPANRELELSKVEKAAAPLGTLPITKRNKRNSDSEYVPQSIPKLTKKIESSKSNPNGTMIKRKRGRPPRSDSGSPISKPRRTYKRNRTFEKDIQNDENKDSKEIQVENSDKGGNNEVFSQDSYKNPDDSYAPIKNIPSDDEKATIVEKINKELESSESPKRDTIRKTTTEKVLDAVDSELLTPTHDSSISPVNINYYDIGKTQRIKEDRIEKEEEDRRVDENIAVIEDEVVPEKFNFRKKAFRRLIIHGANNNIHNDNLTVSPIRFENLPDDNLTVSPVKLDYISPIKASKIGLDFVLPSQGTPPPELSNGIIMETATVKPELKKKLRSSTRLFDTKKGLHLHDSIQIDDDEVQEVNAEFKKDMRNDVFNKDTRKEINIFNKGVKREIKNDIFRKDEKREIKNDIFNKKEVQTEKERYDDDIKSLRSEKKKSDLVFEVSSIEKRKNNNDFKINTKEEKKNDEFKSAEKYFKLSGNSKLQKDNDFKSTIGEQINLDISPIKVIDDSVADDNKRFMSDENVAKSSDRAHRIKELSSKIFQKRNSNKRTLVPPKNGISSRVEKVLELKKSVNKDRSDISMKTVETRKVNLIAEKSKNEKLMDKKLDKGGIKKDATADIDILKVESPKLEVEITQSKITVPRKTEPMKVESPKINNPLITTDSKKFEATNSSFEITPKIRSRSSFSLKPEVVKIIETKHLETKSESSNKLENITKNNLPKVTPSDIEFSINSETVTSDLSSRASSSSRFLDRKSDYIIIDNTKSDEPKVNQLTEINFVGSGKGHEHEEEEIRIMKTEYIPDKKPKEVFIPKRSTSPIELFPYDNHQKEVSSLKTKQVTIERAEKPVRRRSTRLLERSGHKVETDSLNENELKQIEIDSIVEKTQTSNLFNDVSEELIGVPEPTKGRKKRGHPSSEVVEFKTKYNLRSRRSNSINEISSGDIKEPHVAVKNERKRTRRR